MTSTFSHLPADVQAALGVDMTIDITTIGCRTGGPRRIEIWFLNIDGVIYIAGTPGPRDWLANLRKEPTLVFHLKESVTADLPATAIEVTEQGERRRVFGAEVARWYRNQGDALDDLLLDAPLVRIVFD